MKTEQTYLIELIGAPDVRFQVPIYQRVYAWTERQCEELWADVVRTGRGGGDHFIGTVLYGEEGAGAAGAAGGGAARVLDLIDGQQRVATATLMLAALRDALREGGSLADGPGPGRIDARYLRAADGAPKLLLAYADQPTLQAIVEGTPLPEGDDLSQNLVDNYRFFKDRMADGSLDEAWRGMEALLVIAAQLEADDQPQTIFESLNAKGMALSPADLIRNLLFVRFGYDEQKRLYEQYWEPIEAMFPEDENMPDLYLNAALHAWLEENAPQLKLQDKSEIYTAFKAYVRNNPDLPLEDLLRSLNAFCGAFAQDLDGREAKRHTDWVQGKLTGLISERKLFGD